MFRTIGQEWLVTIDDAETYIPEVGEVRSIGFLHYKTIPMVVSIHGF